MVAYSNPIINLRNFDIGLYFGSRYYSESF